MPGPARKHPDRTVRRNTSTAFVTLPAEGRKGRAPKWPLPDEIVPAAELRMWTQAIADSEAELEDPEITPQQKRAARNRLQEARREAFKLEAQLEMQRAMEAKLWRSLWRTPQAEQWEKRGWFREIALYARHQVKAEMGSIRDSAEARQRENLIGLNDKAMKLLGWEIEAKDIALPVGGRRSSGATSSSRSRRGPLTAVPDLPGDSPAPPE